MSSVIVLDDTPADRDLITTVLRSGGWDVFEATSGEDALELARSHRPDLVIADLLIPGMYAFTRALRGDESIRETRVVFCTASYDEREARRTAEACGVSHILLKPSEPAEITRVAGEALDSKPEA